MNAVVFDEADRVMTADKCVGLPVCAAHNKEFNTNEYVSCWEPDDEELAKMLKDIKHGVRPKIYLSCVGLQPPVYVGTELPVEKKVCISYSDSTGKSQTEII